MLQSRNFITPFFLLVSLITGLFVVLELNPDSWGYWWGLGIGGFTATATCFWVERKVRRRMNELSRDPIKNQVNKAPYVSASTSRWMVPTVVGGILLAKIVENIFGQEVQNLINNFISAWIMIGLSYFALLLWRFMPD